MIELDTIAQAREVTTEMSQAIHRLFLSKTRPFLKHYWDIFQMKRIFHPKIIMSKMTHLEMQELHYKSYYLHIFYSSEVATGSGGASPGHLCGQRGESFSFHPTRRNYEKIRAENVKIIIVFMRCGLGKWLGTGTAASSPLIGRAWSRDLYTGLSSANIGQCGLSTWKICVRERNWFSFSCKSLQCVRNLVSIQTSQQHQTLSRILMRYHMIIDTTFQPSNFKCIRRKRTVSYLWGQMSV